MAAEQAITRLEFDARPARAGAEEFAASARRVIEANRQIEASEAKKSAALTKAANDADVMVRVSDRVVTSLSSQQRFLDRLARQYDPFNSAVRQAQGELGRLNGIISQGGEKAAQASTLLAGAQQKLVQAQQAVSAASNDNVRSMGLATASAGQMRASLVNLGQQAQDVAVSLQAGQAPLTVLMQQGSQIATIFAATPGGVSGVLGAAATAIRGIITPTTLAVAGVAALAAGVGILVARASDANQSMRVFDVTLRGMGATALANAASLEAAAKRLRDVGLSAAEARAQITGVARAGLNPAAAEQIIRAGANLSAYLGGDQTQALTGALSGGTEAAVKYGLAVRALTVSQAQMALEMARAGNAGRALDLVLQSITRHAKDMERDALTPAARAFRDMGVAWSNAMDALMKTGPIQIVVGALGDMATVIERVAKGMVEIREIGKGAAVGAVIGGAAGSAVPIVGTTVGALVGAGTGAIMAAGSQALENPTFTAGIPPAAVAGLKPELQIALRDMIADAANDGIVLGIGSGLRSTQRQAQLYAADLARNGGVASGMVAPPGRSQHEVGGAADLVNAQGQLVRAGSPEAAWLAANASRYVTRPMSYEPWHVEPPGGRTGAGAGVATFSPNPLGALEAAERVRMAKEEAAATAGVGLANDKLQAQLDASRMALEKSLDTDQRKTLALGLIEAATTRAELALSNAAAATEKEIALTDRMAASYHQSAAAGMQAEAQAKAETEVYQRLGETTSDLAKSFIDLRASQNVALEQSSLRRTFEQANQQDERSIAVARLQIQLQGQTTEEITKQVALLNVKLDAEAKGLSVQDQSVQNRLREVNALGQANAQLVEAQRNQQRLDDGIRSIASTVENTLTRSIEDAFSGRKVEDWGTRIKSMLGSLVAQISDALFIKPLIGSLIGALGFGSAAQSFGSFGSLFGGGGQTLTGTVGGQPATFSLSNVSSGLSVLDKIGSSFGQGGFFGNPFGSLFGSSGSSGGGLFGGTGSFFNSSLGGIFAGPAGAPFSATVQGPSLPGLAGFQPQGLFGDLTLGSAFTGIGGGFGAGSLLNSLIGGNKLFGSIGSGLGSLAGTLGLGPIGGLIGGALFGALGGLFGNNKPRNASAGGGFDLATGQITGTFQGGNPQIDQPTLQALQQLSGGLAILKTLPGNTLAGQILFQNGVNTGTTVDWSGLTGVSGFEGSGRMSLGKDPAAAALMIFEAVSRGLTGVSDTVRKIIDNTTDLTKLAENLSFAATYEKINEAFESAFASIPNEIQDGPFKQALDQITAIFGDVTAKATEFGLDLEPVNAALAEASKRLTDDFNVSIADMILQITDPVQFGLDQISKAGDALIRDAEAVGGDLVQVNRLIALQLDQVWQQELDSVRSLRDSLVSGSLSGLRIVDQVAAANDNFRNTLALVQGGDFSQLGALTSAGQTALQLSTTAYGNAPQTAGLRTEILAAMDSILAAHSFAEGGIAPVGWNLVGERGPEWMYMPSPAMVVPNGGGGGMNFARVEALLTALLAELRGTGEVSRAGYGGSIARLERIAGALERPALPTSLPRQAA